MDYCCVFVISSNLRYSMKDKLLDLAEDVMYVSAFSLQLLIPLAYTYFMFYKGYIVWLM
jgi:hypothetical protein